MTPVAQPPVLGGPCPYLSVSNAAQAAEFYVTALGAHEVMRMPPDDRGRYMHIHLVINGGSLMLADAFPEHVVQAEDEKLRVIVPILGAMRVHETLWWGA